MQKPRVKIKHMKLENQKEFILARAEFMESADTWKGIP